MEVCQEPAERHVYPAKDLFINQSALTGEAMPAEKLVMVPAVFPIKFMRFIRPISSIFDYETYVMMLFVFDAWANAPPCQTGWFVESLLTQTLIIHIMGWGL
jgi:hypothetical protein